MDTKLTRPIQRLLAALTVFLLSAVSAKAASPTAAPLTLSDAIAIALQHGQQHQLAQDETRLTQAEVQRTQAALYPQISFTEAALLGDDPVYVFGSHLRQARFTTADFALPALNQPNAVDNFTTRLSGNWVVFDSFASIEHIHQARARQAATQKALARTDQELIAHTIAAYTNWVLARKLESMAQQTVNTAAALAQSSETRLQAGTTVAADAMAANVNLAMRQQAWLDAQSQTEIARAQLEAILGVDLPATQLPVADLAAPSLPLPSLQQAEEQALQHRTDMQAATLALASQTFGVRGAKAGFGPSIHVFGDYEADNPSLVSGGNTNWMIGAELRINLFDRTRAAELAAANAEKSLAMDQQRSLHTDVLLEVRQAYFSAMAAEKMLAVAQGAIAQSQESLRITQNRYDAGLTTITELLRAEDAARLSRINYWQAVAHSLTARTTLDLATGALTTQSPVVTQ